MRRDEGVEVPVGLVVVGVNGQRYRCIDVVDDEQASDRFADRPIRRAIWQTSCCNCDFEFTVQGFAKLVAPNRFRTMCHWCAGEAK